ncbi:T6SS immunity protein Tli3 family protein [Dyella flava]|uniref:T6SS immunity protein Tli3 family protein n=1 Tax=Dyella flava TaxID=1920170 RepID=UPI003CCDD9B0
MAYSTDSGRTFHWLEYMTHSFVPTRDSASYTIAVTQDSIYVAHQFQYDASVDRCPLVDGIDLSKPYPPGLHDSGFWASEKPDFLAGLKTPSGQDHFTCDESIRPSNLPGKTP